MERFCWINGEIKPEKEAVMSVYDSALMFGDMAFEMTRSFKNRTFMLREHLERLNNTCKYLRINHGKTLAELEEMCLGVQMANKFADDDEHRLMINISRGLLGIYRETGHLGPNIIITDFPLRWTVQGMGELYDRGVNAAIVHQRSPRGFEPRLKCRSRAHFLMANIEAAGRHNEHSWALLTDDNGDLTEGTGANIFIVKKDVLYTPPAIGTLAGISRQYVMKLAKEAAVRCEEYPINPYDLITADEAFFTGTPFCILPITYCEDVPIGQGKLGPVTRFLLRNWSYNVKVNIPEQIKAWDEGREVDGATPYRFKK